ncbi:nucleotidyltransferase [Agrilactobacillus fermenti]|uniref:nucleotidyltransferase n=1 Tax=Agrilactobacillus fermenti TaxID=2586909 RepID=UPI001E4571C6|nr:nucleotidyltransferase [Agrilactobacillus fermenti]MCD2256679.1 nucleotidyltransferase [Agrilactobacillus fermenti]
MQQKKLTACGVIAEYNPFHTGHAYQLKMARIKTHADVLVVVMSGNFVQRGEIAIVDKYQRTAMALANGADLVVELPFSNSVQPADLFAKGALTILSALQCEHLAFGTEVAEINYQQLGFKLRQLPNRNDYFVDYRKTYATQINEFFQNELGLSFDQPNMLLAASYARANADLAMPLSLVPIQRVGVEHDSSVKTGKYQSASALRNQLLAGVLPEALTAFLPQTSVFELKQAPKFLNWTNCFEFLKYRLLSTDLERLAKIYQINEGLEYRILQHIRDCDSFTDFLHAIKTKRYTFARLQRVLTYILLGVTKSEMHLAKDFVHPLGFNECGRAYLNQVKKQITLPIITRANSKNTKSDGLFYLQNRVDQFVELLTHVSQNYGRQPIYIRR